MLHASTTATCTMQPTSLPKRRSPTHAPTSGAPSGSRVLRLSSICVIKTTRSNTRVTGQTKAPKLTAFMRYVDQTIAVSNSTLQVHLISQHVWGADYMVRSLYLKNTETNETRTVTQFHYLAWSESSVPTSAKSLLEFRRKVNKSYRGRSTPILVHCTNGTDRTGVFCLVDIVVNRVTKGAGMWQSYTLLYKQNNHLQASKKSTSPAASSICEINASAWSEPASNTNLRLAASPKRCPLYSSRFNSNNSHNNETSSICNHKVDSIDLQTPSS